MYLRKKIGEITRIALALIIFLPAASPAFEIAIFKSKNLGQYNDAVNGFKVNCQAKFSEYDMEENPERGRQIVKTIKDSKPDLIVTIGVNAALLTTREIKDIPVVFAMVLNPGNYDLSGKNVTGVSLEVPVKTQLFALKSIVPKVSNVGVIYNPKNTQELIKEAQKSAKELGFNLISAKVDSPQDTPRAFRAFSGGIDAFWMIPDPTVVTQEAFRMILDFTYKNNVPFIAFSKSFVDAGALVSLSPNYASIGQQACQVAQKIMQGGKVSEIPVQSPKGLEMTFNINTAKKLGLENIATQAITFAASEGYKISVSQ